MGTPVCLPTPRAQVGGEGFLEETAFQKPSLQGFPGGPLVTNPPFNEGDVGSIPGRGTKTPHPAGQLNLCAATSEPTGHN